MSLHRLAVFVLALLWSVPTFAQPQTANGYNATAAVPVSVSAMPFRRLHSAPIRLKAIGPVAKSFPINRPAEATTYRIVVPCDVDIRLLGTITAGEAVTEDTGVLYLARTEATMGTTRPNFISAMTVGTPTGECTPEMHYGMGGG